jgi:flavin-binding protein dodecin
MLEEGRRPVPAGLPPKEVLMHDIARVTEITARSSRSFEDAVRAGLARADATLRNVEGAWIKEQKIAMHDGEIESYQVDMLVTFVLDDDQAVDRSA